jgi:aldehyde:ferredoxin oxidoreductase
MSVKKQEIPAYDARAIQGIGINYATANCGAAHVRGYMIAPEVLGIPALGAAGYLLAIILGVYLLITAMKNTKP